jgi:hypothetical protein
MARRKVHTDGMPNCQTVPVGASTQIPLPGICCIIGDIGDISSDIVILQSLPVILLSLPVIFLSLPVILPVILLYRVVAVWRLKRVVC